MIGEKGARGHFAPRTFYPTDILPQGHFAPGHFAPSFVKIVDILPQDILAQFFLHISLAYFGHILGIPRAYLGHILGISWAYLEHISGISWAYLGYILGISHEVIIGEIPSNFFQQSQKGKM